VNLKRKEVKAMKYQTPELTALMSAISAVQGAGDKGMYSHSDSIPTDLPEQFAAYADWE
jgi:hypothetical protein